MPYRENKMYSQINRYRDAILLEAFLSEKDFNIETFLSKFESVATLAKRGATEGERSASKTAMIRLFDRAKTESQSMPSQQGVSFLKRVQAIIDGISRPEPAPKPRPSARPEQPRTPLYKVGSWIYCIPLNTAVKITNIVTSKTRGNFYGYTTPEGEQIIAENLVRKATQEEVDAALATKPKPQSKANSSADGWLVNILLHNTEGTSDKIWGSAYKTKHGKEHVVVFWGKRKGPLAAKDSTETPKAVAVTAASKASRGYKSVNNPQFIADVTKLVQTARGLPVL